MDEDTFSSTPQNMKHQSPHKLQMRQMPDTLHLDELQDNENIVDSASTVSDNLETVLIAEQHNLRNEVDQCSLYQVKECQKKMEPHDVNMLNDI